MRIIFKKGRSYRRLFPYQRTFGAVTTFSPNLSVDAGYLDVEPVGNVNCTCFTVGKIGSAETGKHYDYTWLWTQMVKLGKTSLFGATPQDAFDTAIKGMKVVPTGELDTFPAYFRVDEGQFDSFTNLKSAMQMEFNLGNKRPIGCGTQWYSEFNVGSNEIAKEGKTHIADHEWLVCGWDESHKDMFKVDAHLGHYIYMPQDVFNKAFKDTYGAVGLTLAKTSQEVIDFHKGQSYSRIQSAIDAITNLLKLIQSGISLLVKKNNQPIINNDYQEVKETIKPMNTILKWAKLIARFEGADPKLNNPGNIKFTPFIATLGGMKTKDSGFATFATPEKGMSALCEFLILACKNELKPYHNARTIKLFTLVYTDFPKPAFDYSDALIKELGVTVNTDISTFL